MNTQIKYINKRLEWIRDLVPILRKVSKKYNDPDIKYCRAEIVGSVREIETRLKKIEGRLK